MSAVVLDFQQAVRKRNGVAKQRAVGLGVEDAITQAVMDHFKEHPLPALAAAIHSARIAIANGSGFIQAMDAAARTIHESSAGAKNNDSNTINPELLKISALMIRAHLRGTEENEIDQAINRARRVLLGGGSLCTAIYHAINIEKNA